MLAPRAPGVLELFESDSTAAITQNETVPSASMAGWPPRGIRCGLKGLLPVRSRRGRWGVVAISPPPAIIMSASPYWIVRMPSPMA